MTVAYFDCFAGASGDMILGALVDAGLDIGDLREILSKLSLKGFKLKTSKVRKGGIEATKVDVEAPPATEHRHLRDVLDILDSSSLDTAVKTRSGRIFTRLAEAEARIHGTSPDDIHFHEIGAVDAIVDIVGAVAGLAALGIEQIHASKLPSGTGKIECSHGILPNPAPATLELLKGIPTYSTGIPHELVTPTGAAILTTLAVRFGDFPSLRIERIGYGAGTADLPIPNVLRLMVGQSDGAQDSDGVRILETHIDDMNPQWYEYVMERLFEAGAKDVTLTPMIMKKNRPGILLRVIAEPGQVDGLTEVLFQETTTIGIRISEIQMRRLLVRNVFEIETPWGKAHVKTSLRNGKPSYTPEYDDCRRLARLSGLPLAEISDRIRKEARSKPPLTDSPAEGQ
jgi:uncharacterized protein (TIGR00299 family) protein